MARLHLAPFDRDRDFVTQRAFLCRGKNYRQAAPFDKHSVSIRTLRILYEGRSIGYADDQIAEPPTPKLTAADKAELLKLDRSVLVDRATAIGITIKPRATKAVIVAEIARVRDGAAYR